MKLGNTGRLTIIWVVLGILILVNSYFFPAGYLNLDSTRYLQLAGNLLDGQGFLVPDYTYHEGLTWFSIWPVGYPVAITLIAWIFHLPVFWASKVLNILIIGLTFMLLTKWFRQQAWFIALVFFIDTLITVYTMTWSEGLFLLLLLWYCYSMWNYIHFYENKRYLVYLIISSLLLFLTRYIGGIFIVPLGILSFYFFRKKQHKQATFLLISATILVFIETGYLYMNYVKTGFTTGVPRYEQYNSAGMYFYQLIEGIVREIIPISDNFTPDNILSFHTRLVISIIGIATFLSILFVLLKNQKLRHTFIIRINSVEFILISIGLFYLLVIMTLKIFLHFDKLNLRVLSPFTLMFYITVGLLMVRTQFIKRNQKIIFLTVIVFGLVFYSPYVEMAMLNGFKRFSLSTLPNSMEYEASVLNYYEFIDPNSVVIFPNDRINYLFKDIFSAEPKIKEDGSKENIDEMIIRFKNIQSINSVFIEIRDDIPPGQYHPSIYQFMEEHKGEKFYRIK